MSPIAMRERYGWMDGLTKSACRRPFIMNFAPGLVAIMRRRRKSAVQKLKITFASD